jgi:hypothetical protein
VRKLPDGLFCRRCAGFELEKRSFERCHLIADCTAIELLEVFHTHSIGLSWAF